MQQPNTLAFVFALVVELLLAACPGRAQESTEPQHRLEGLPLSFYEEQGLLPEEFDDEETSEPCGLKQTTCTWTLRTRQWDLDRPQEMSIDLCGMRRVECRSIRIENRGRTDIKNPWVTMNGRRNWFSNATIQAEAFGQESDPELRAFRLWDLARKSRYHWAPAEDGLEMHSPVKLLNVYGYGFCDDSAHFLESMWKFGANGRARSWGLNGHVVPELWYKGGWHVFDADLEAFFPLKNNRTVASVAELTSNPKLVSRVLDDSIAQLYATRDNVCYQDWVDTAPVMAMTLRPNESLERCFYNWGKYHDQLHYSSQPPPVFGNGRQRWKPDLTNLAVALQGFSLAENISGPSAAPPGAFTPEAPGKEACLEWHMRAPYVYVGGRLSAQVSLESPSDWVRFVMLDEEEEEHVLAEQNGPYEGKLLMNLDGVIEPMERSANYNLALRAVLYGPSATLTGRPGAVIRSLETCAEVQCAPAALPQLEAGKVNSAKVTFEGAQDASLHVAYSWLATRDAAPLRAPQGPLSPADGSTVGTCAPMLSWSGFQAENPAIWRSVKVSWDAGGFHPVSPRTCFSGTQAAHWQVPSEWLIPGNTYFWHVQEQSENAPSSSPWAFHVESDLRWYLVNKWEALEEKSKEICALGMQSPDSPDYSEVFDWAEQSDWAEWAQWAQWAELAD